MRVKLIRICSSLLFCPTGACVQPFPFFGVLSLRNLRKQFVLENTEEMFFIHLALQLAIVTSQGNLCSHFHFRRFPQTNAKCRKSNLICWQHCGWFGGAVPLRNAITDGAEGVKTKKLNNTLPKAQRTQGIQYFDSINNFISELAHRMPYFSVLVILKYR